MKIVTTGGRDYFDYAHVMWTLEILVDDLHASRLAHGACRGADELAGRIARGLGITVHEYPVDHALDGPWPEAGPARNRRMLETERPDLLVAFVGGRGTASCVRIAEDLGIPILHARTDILGAVEALGKAGALR